MSWLPVVALALSVVGCGGGSSASSAESSGGTEGSAGDESTAASGADGSTGACYLASMGACQWFYDTEEPHTESGCVGLEGTFGADCPTEGRLGDCMENGRLAGRMYVGGPAADAAAAQSSCEAGGGTFVP
ncbi:MAG: hypothetical protein U0353_06020 [Sandaracinus sp.]